MRGKGHPMSECRAGYANCACADKACELQKAIDDAYSALLRQNVTGGLAYSGDRIRKAMKILGDHQGAIG